MVELVHLQTTGSSAVSKYQFYWLGPNSKIARIKGRRWEEEARICAFTVNNWQTSSTGVSWYQIYRLIAQIAKCQEEQSSDQGGMQNLHNVDLKPI